MSLDTLLKAASITQEMIDRRDRMRAAHGAGYDAAIEPARHIVLGYARKHKLSTIQAAIKICTEAVKNGHGSAVNLVMAAAVDLIEEGYCVPNNPAS